MNTPDLEDLVEQFLDQCRNGEKRDMKDFIAQHSEHAEELQELLPLVMEMERLREEPNSDETFVFPEQNEEWSRSITVPTLDTSDYRLIKKVGSGGMGVVFEALQLSLNRKVAVKLLSPHLVSDARQRRQFEQEARVIAMLHHPNIVQVFSAGSESGFGYYAMEFIDGKGLDLCEFNDLREIAQMGLQAAEALAYAHRCNVVHRDIKPANLLCDGNHELRVSDFGIACILPDNHEMVENSGSKSGTLRYMAPERLTDGISSFAADQYSLGATLYELITRSPMLSAETPQELIRQICKGDIPPLKCSEPDLAAIIHKSLSVSPQDRYASMDDFADDLRHFLNHESPCGIPVSVFHRLGLWIYRKPVVAILSLGFTFCAAAFVFALILGFIRTSAALKLAAENARIADAAMTRAFEYVEAQIPSQRGTQLLATLMPYYQNISQQRNLPDSRIAEAHHILGAYAMRAGDFALAETEFRQLVKLRPCAFSENQLSESLRLQGKTDEANALAREIVKQYADSKNPIDRLETVHALQSLAASQTSNVENTPESAELTQAFQMIQTLLLADPKNPEYRFQYAILLGGNPRLFRSNRISGVEPNAIVLLNELTEEYPEQPDYGIALIEIMYRKLYYSKRVRPRDREAMTVALKMSDILLGRFPNTPKVVSSVVRFREEYIHILRQNRQEVDARRETERLVGMLEILRCNPEVPDVVRECLLRFHLQRLENIVYDQRTSEVARLSAEIKEELKQYHGPLLSEFQQRFAAINPQ